MANEFKDTEGRTWRLSIVVGDLKRCRESVGVELGKLVGDKLTGLMELVEDPEKFVGVLWVLIEKQAKEKSVTPEMFGESLGGDALEAAVDAFVGALADFSPSASRKLLREWAKTKKEFEEKATDRAVKRMNEAMPATLDRLDETLKKSLGDLLGSSESTPANGPSANSTG